MNDFLRIDTERGELSVDADARVCMAGVPEIPQRPTIRERPRGVELKWTGVGGGNDSGPLLYIVDSRWNIGRQQNDADMSPWQQVAQVGTNNINITFLFINVTLTL